MTGEIELTPQPGILIESLRDIGYSFESALADIIDNSITANASEISVMALPVNDSFAVSILDDGDGLDRDSLLQSMRLGSSNPRDARAADDLGRFGLGLKTASFSQCRRLTVVSRQQGRTSAFTWDLDVVVRENSWSVLERTDYDSIFGYDTMPETGTLVLWEKVDRLAGNNGTGRMISEAQDHLSLVFHRFLSRERGTKGLAISFNGRILEPLDPFNMSNDATQASPEEVVCPGVTLRSFTLPHVSTYSSRSEYEQYGLRGGYLRNQGVYLYRAKRLIIFGTWFGLAKKTALTQLTRVKIDIGTDQDEAWKIDVKKVSAQMPEIVRKRVRSLIQTIGAPSRKVYSRRGARLTSPDVYPVWTRSENGEKTTYSINIEHPLVRAFDDELDESMQKRFTSLIAFIGAMLPTEALFYDISNNADAVEPQRLSHDDFAANARVFYAAIKQFKDDEGALESMRAIEPYRSRWDETLSALGIEES